MLELKDGFVLYHGSYCEVKEPDLAKCAKRKDFGQGFYLTDIEEQAKKMAIRVAKIYGKKPIVNVYEIADNFKDLDNLKIKNFGTETTEEWAKFVMNNRSRSFTDTKNTLCNKDNKYCLLYTSDAADEL